MARPVSAAPAVEVPTAPRLIGARRLSAVVFVSGAGSLAIEICASRLLAPYFGSSTVVWANVIGLILIYLSVGYWVGGRIADRHASPRLLGRLLLVAAAVIAVLPFVARPVLDVAVRGFDAVSVGAVVGSFFATVALFSVPVTLLGMVSPFAIRLALRDVGEAGTVSGQLYALSTAGSIAGTFAPALVTIPTVGTQRTMLGAAVLLGVAGAALRGWRSLVVAAVAFGLLFVPPGAIKGDTGLLFETESPYQYVRVVQNADGKRELELNEGVSQQSVWRPNTVLTGGEWDMFLVVPPLLTHPVRNVLVIGSAGGTIPRAYAQFYPDAHVDGVEIDPAVTLAARRFMGLDDIPNLHVHSEDGRGYLRSTSQQYDVIVVDAYREEYVPFYLATQEFFRLVQSHLRPGGAVALNVAQVPEDHRLPDAVAGTLATVFPQVWQWPALRFNQLVVGLTSPSALPAMQQRLTARLAPPIASLGPLFSTQAFRTAPSSDPMTDDRAPIEWITDRMIIEHISRGEGLDESLLPTAP
ncbi:MAG TPA: fused MFS/spermidine synthase [Candidatus Dormibacteraeota bacterium]|nr:fused MFS/spermidine synthase [Candidatus Dormibacteraeota bacterium]